MNSFLRGLRYRNPVVLMVAAALVWLVLLGIQALFTTGAWTAIPLDRCLRNSKDSLTYVSWTVGRARRHPPSTPVLYLLGGSGVRESILSGEALAAEIEGLGGPSVAAYDLGFTSQSLAESLAVTEAVPDTPAWLVVGVNLGRFTVTPEQNALQRKGRRLLVGSSPLQGFLPTGWGVQNEQHTILPGIWAYVTGWLGEQGAPRLLEGRLPSVTYDLHRYTQATAASRRQKDGMVSVWNTSRYREFERNLDQNLELLEQLLATARQRGVHIVLLELPVNEEVVGDRFDRALREYRQPVAALARDYDVPYVDLNETTHIPDADFQDLWHLVEPGRVTWQHALATKLAELMKSEGAHE